MPKPLFWLSSADLLLLGLAAQGILAVAQEVLGDVGLGHGALQFAHVPETGINLADGLTWI